LNADGLSVAQQYAQQGFKDFVGATAGPAPIVKAPAATIPARRKYLLIGTKTTSSAK
jgi:hypothetical protein